MVATQDFEVVQGEAFDPFFVFKQSRAPDADPVDLTGAAARFTVRRGPKIGDALFFELTRGAGLTFTDLEGKIEVVQAGALTLGWEPGTYYHTFNVTIGGTPKVYIQGRLVVKPTTANPA